MNRTHALPVFYSFSIAMLLLTQGSVWIWSVLGLTLYYMIRLMRCLRQQTLLNVEYTFDFEFYNLHVVYQRDKSTEYKAKWTVSDMDLNDGEEEAEGDVKTPRDRTWSTFICMLAIVLYVFMSTVYCVAIRVIFAIMGVYLHDVVISFVGWSLLSVYLFITLRRMVLRSCYNLTMAFHSSLFDDYSMILMDYEDVENSSTIQFKKITPVTETKESIVVVVDDTSDPIKDDPEVARLISQIIDVCKSKKTCKPTI